MPIPEYKYCPTCQQTKPSAEFYRKAGASDGLRSECKECWRARDKAWRAANPKQMHVNLKRWRHRYPEKATAATRRHRRRYPEKRKAQNEVNHAIRDGRLTRPDLCENCGGPGQPFDDDRAPIQAHHHDYSKPLDVEWLCRDCHGARHLNQPD